MPKKLPPRIHVLSYLGLAEKVYKPSFGREQGNVSSEFGSRNSESRDFQRENQASEPRIAAGNQGFGIRSNSPREQGEKPLGWPAKVPGF